MRRLPLKELPRYECLIEAAQLYPELDPSACEVYLNLIHIVDLLSEKEEAYLAKYDLSQARFVVLKLLSIAEEGSVKSSDIADRAAVSKATMTGLLDALERQGLIERIIGKEDRRVIFVKLSKKGKSLLARMTPGYFKCISQMTSVLREEERKRIVASMQKIKTELARKEQSSK